MIGDKRKLLVSCWIFPLCLSLITAELTNYHCLWLKLNHFRTIPLSTFVKGANIPNRYVKIQPYRKQCSVILQHDTSCKSHTNSLNRFTKQNCTAGYYSQYIMILSTTQLSWPLGITSSPWMACSMFNSFKLPTHLIFCLLAQK